MTTTWILVANASQAKLYSRPNIKNGLSLVKTLTHPASRMKNAELVTDRSGSLQSGGGHGARQPQTEPKQNEAIHFAQTLAQELNQGRNEQQFGQIVLMAPPAFLGLLNDKLDAHTAKLITLRLDKDYTQASDKDILNALGW